MAIGLQLFVVLDIVSRSLGSLTNRIFTYGDEQNRRAGLWKTVLLFLDASIYTVAWSFARD